MKTKRVAFVYHGSAGVPGGYTAKFLEGLAIHCTVHAFVNHRYMYQHENENIIIHRIFFPLTDTILGRKTFVRRVFRFIELLIGYVFVIKELVSVRFTHVIYSPITNLWLTKKFVEMAKRLSNRLVVVVHDSQSHFDILEKHRDAVYECADILIFHNEHSKISLQERLSTSGKPVLLPFPWSLNKFPANRSGTVCDLLLVGHVRPSKGIDFLIDAYPKYKSLGGNLKLTVAGSMSLSVRRRLYGVASNVIDYTLGDQQFIDLISASKFVIMPYQPDYSNSSVHYCALIHCQKPFICSDIRLFSQFEHGVDCLKFQYGDLDSLAMTLRLAERFCDAERNLMAANALRKIKIDIESFEFLVGNLFSE